MPLPHSPTENHLRAALPAVELVATEVITEGARFKQSDEEIRGEPVERVMRHHPEPENSTYERLLGDAIRAPMCWSSVQNALKRPERASIGCRPRKTR